MKDEDLKVSTRLPERMVIAMKVAGAHRRVSIQTLMTEAVARHPDIKRQLTGGHAHG